MPNRDEDRIKAIQGAEALGATRMRDRIACFVEGWFGAGFEGTIQPLYMQKLAEEIREMSVSDEAGKEEPSAL